MLAPLVLLGHLPVSDLEQRSRGVQGPVARDQRQSIWLLSTGHRAEADTDVTSCSVNWLRRFARRYGLDGPVGVGDYRRCIA